MEATASADCRAKIDDARIKRIRPLLPPEILLEEFPLTLPSAQSVIEGRVGAEKIIKGEDDRLLVIVGPCSVHDVKAAVEYAHLLKEYAAQAKADLQIIMRVYFEKPRTTVGWKGLINDPQLNGSYNINKGLRLARGLLLQITALGLPTAVEFLDTISPQFIADVVSWGAIGARTTESQVHRELASGMSAPIGFKNGTDGSINVAVDAIRASREGHVFLSVTKQGLSAIVETDGNDATHIIMRGSNKGPNYSADNVKSVAQQLQKAGLHQRVMIDCSHGNSEKDHNKQPVVANCIAEQLSSLETCNNIAGVMIESHLKSGKQSIPSEGPAYLEYGQSVTDACIDWDTTVKTLDRLREGVQARRRIRAQNGTAVVNELSRTEQNGEFNPLDSVKPQ